MITTEVNSKKKCLSALDEYINKVFVLVLLMVSIGCQLAGLLYTFEKIMGWLPSVKWIVLIVFDLTCFIYVIVCVYIIRTSFKDGLIIKSKLKFGKIFLVILLFIQFNFILYMIPSTDFWGYAFFFLIFTVFFLDYKMVAITALEIAASIVVAWILSGEIHLPIKDEFFMVNFLNRISCISLSLPTTIILTYLLSRFLVNAKKDEMERNTEQVKRVLVSVQSISENLHSAGTTLYQVSENESASAQELSATSEELLSSSNQLSVKTDTSMTNLKELNEWEAIVVDNVKKVESSSTDLLHKSKDNEILLSDLQTINNEVYSSMKATIDVAHKLSDAVKEIGVTLNLINEISSSTNLLALNASIEAARVGEAGKGFTVVAQEVGNLANNTRNSLQEVEAVIERVQNNVNEITLHVEENSQKLDNQNEYFNKIFKGMKDMTELLNTSVGAINTMGDAQNKQSEVIKNTVCINQDIAESIKNENGQFTLINDMVESNVNDITEMTAQANVINEMVEQIRKLLDFENQ